VIVALFVIQVVLGAETVRLANVPVSVVLHWGTAMAFIAALSAMAVFAAASDRTLASNRHAVTSPEVGLALALTAAAAFVTMCVGAYVSSSGAGLACLSIPGCAGNVVVYTAGQDVQMLHRVAAAITLVLAAAALALAWARPAATRTRAAAAVGVGLIAVQILLGLLNVALRLPVDLREAHAVNAAFAFLAFFVAGIFAMLDSVPRGASRLTTNGAQR
jgi:cytochrome c oxidase assembly protein subunit 15